MVRSFEGRFASDHLVEDGTNRPKVYPRIVLLVAQNFRGHVEGRAAKGLGQGCCRQRACKTKVGNLEGWKTLNPSVRYQRSVVGRIGKDGRSDIGIVLGRGV